MEINELFAFLRSDFWISKKDDCLTWYAPDPRGKIGHFVFASQRFGVLYFSTCHKRSRAGRNIQGDSLLFTSIKTLKTYAARYVFHAVQFRPMVILASSLSTTKQPNHDVRH